MAVHTYNVAMTCGGCSGAVTRILTKQLGEGEKFDVRTQFFEIAVKILSGESRSKDCESPDRPLRR